MTVCSADVYRMRPIACSGQLKWHDIWYFDPGIYLCQSEAYLPISWRMAWTKPKPINAVGIGYYFVCFRRNLFSTLVHLDQSAWEKGYILICHHSRPNGTAYRIHFSMRMSSSAPTKQWRPNTVGGIIFTVQLLSMAHHLCLRIKSTHVRPISDTWIKIYEAINVTWQSGPYLARSRLFSVLRSSGNIAVAKLTAGKRKHRPFFFLSGSPV